MKLTIFSTESCPRCRLLAAKLHELCYQPDEKPMVEASGAERADCITSEVGYWPFSAPLLRVEFGPDAVCWYADVSLFPRGDMWLDEDKLRAILGQAA